ncbi:glycerophosphodiester phosphodiesterase [Neptunicella marina]|uniref:glycerophosphodiester phosphodiesterase n=1 Tax=Neptunicella marina TaxID=2125989 RepID=A0A8J6M040_9ALTE|nr:glycerophosphodiester phosphodiesterase [Neptunicella marina]MBC3766820.1 glycerophosphodiester phosphodiesterase [Neptunicella marina]
MQLAKLLFITFTGLLTIGPTFAKPVVIGHRGAPGYVPEHTMESAILAYNMGADFIEQDLVVTKDLKLVVLHDIHLETVTDVEQRFPERHRKDGRYYALDFTLAELKTLRVHERTDEKGQQVFKGRYHGYADFRIATFDDEFELITQLNRMTGKQTGFYPEIKSPAWHRQQGVDISQLVINKLRQKGLDDPEKNIYVQCFDFEELKRLRNELGAKVRLVQLLGENSWNEAPTDYDFLKTPAGLKELAQTVQGIGPWLPQILDVKTGKATGLVAQAHQLGLMVHPYTFRVDALPDGITAIQLQDILFQQIKVDGLFSDFTDVTVKYLAQMVKP